MIDLSGGVADLVDENVTGDFGRLLAEMLRAGDVILLTGPLGAGKTTLVRAMVAALGGDPAEVCSPTFVLHETYAVAAGALRRFHHVDLYRLRGRTAAPYHELGLEEAIEDRAAVTAIEWPDELGWEPGAGTRVLRVALEYHGEGRRARVELVADDSP